MKTTSIALLFLVLLVSHETISVANAIKMHQRNLNQHKIHHTAKAMLEMIEGDMDTFFLETQQEMGSKMSMEAYQTMEIKQAHQALVDHWSFEKSPIRNEVKHLPTLKSNDDSKILSKEDIVRHQQHISVLLEKAMTHMMGHGLQKAPGKCSYQRKSQKLTKRISTFFKTGNSHLTCSADSECKPDASKGLVFKLTGGRVDKSEGPCQSGKCVCDKTRLNECECVLTDEQKHGLAALTHKSDTIEKSIIGIEGLKSAAFGFIDGFTSGMVKEIKHAFESKQCKDTKSMKAAVTVDFVKSIKGLFKQLKQIHRVFKSEYRAKLKKAFKNFLKAIAKVLKEIGRWLWKCPGTKQLAVIAAIILSGMAVMAIPGFGMIIGFIGKLAGFYFKAKYVVNAVWDISENTIKAAKGKCKLPCKKIIVEKFFGIAGAMVELLLPVIQKGSKGTKKLNPMNELKHAAKESAHGKAGFMAKMEHLYHKVHIGEIFAHKPVGWVLHANEARNMKDTWNTARLLEKGSHAHHNVDKEEHTAIGRGDEHETEDEATSSHENEDEHETEDAAPSSHENEDEDEAEDAAPSSHENEDEAEDAATSSHENEDEDDTNNAASSTDEQQPTDASSRLRAKTTSRDEEKEH